MNDASPPLSLHSEHDLDIATRTLVGECRGEVFLGQVAVAHVMLNRWRKPGWWSRERDTVPDDTLAAVCVDASQFSCWNINDPNLRYIAIIPPTHPEYLYARSCLLQAVCKLQVDPTFGSTHYHAFGLEHAPPWAEGKMAVVSIGRHQFYNDIT